MLNESCVLFFARSELSWGSGRERSTSGNIGGHKFRKLKLEDKGVVVERGPLMAIGGNKFEKLKLEDTRVVVGRGPLVEVGGNKFGKLTLKDTGVVVVTGPLVEIGEGDSGGMGLSWEGLEHSGVLGDTVSGRSSLDILSCSSAGDKALFWPRVSVPLSLAPGTLSCPVITSGIIVCHCSLRVWIFFSSALEARQRTLISSEILK